MDAVSGKLVAGDLSAAPAAARVRLWILFGLSALSCFLLMFMFLPTLDAVGAHNWWKGTRPMAGWSHFGPRGSAGLPVILGCPILLVLLWCLYRSTSRSLGEPVRRIQSGRIRLPLDQSWRGIFPALVIAFLLVTINNLATLRIKAWYNQVGGGEALVAVQSLIAAMLTAAFIHLSIGYRPPPRTRPGPQKARARSLLDVILSKWFSALVWIPALFITLHEAFRLSSLYARHNRLPSTTELQVILARCAAALIALFIYHWLVDQRRLRPVAREVEPGRAMIPDLQQTVIMCLRILVLALGGHLIGDLLFRLRVFTELYSLVPYLGPFVCLHLFPLPAFARGPLASGILVEGVASIFLGPLPSLLAVFVAVALYATRYCQQTTRTSLILWPALRLAWSFCLGALLGRLTGRLFALALLPLVGLDGVNVAQVIGFITGAALGIKALGDPFFLARPSRIKTA